VILSKLLVEDLETIRAYRPDDDVITSRGQIALGAPHSLARFVARFVARFGCRLLTSCALPSSYVA
jgi:hypothetical protein